MKLHRRQLIILAIVIAAIPAAVIPIDGRAAITLAASRSASAFEQTGGKSEDRRPLAVAYDTITFVPATALP
jgi:hypothetical protein